jgi:uncharacterized protein (TIGR04255 family)
VNKKGKAAKRTMQRYRNPPLVEAVSEFRFSGRSRWDSTVPGRVYERLQAGFPIRETSKAIGLATSEAPRFEVQFLERSIFRKEDRSALVQVAPRLLAINHLKPYPGWERFAVLIEEAYAAYTEVAAPDGFHRIGLRYINRFDLLGETTDLEEILELRPFLGSRMPQPLVSFNLGIHLPYEDARDLLRVQVTSSAPPGFGITIDLDYFLAMPDRLASNDWLKWLGEAHSRLEEVFEASTTEHARKQIFGEIS